MISLLPEPWWPTLALAVVLGADALVSLRPPAVIRDCLDGVGFPRDWWWTLVVVKLLAATGLVVGLWVPGVALSATVGVVVYFLCAAAAHLRSGLLGTSFWINCLGMLTVSVAVLVVSALP